jgi:hypothetical protein
MSLGAAMPGRRRWLVSSSLHAGELIFASDLTREERRLAGQPANRLREPVAWSELDVSSRWAIARLLGVHETHFHQGELARETFERAVRGGAIVGLRFEDRAGQAIRPRFPVRRAALAQPSPEPRPDVQGLARIESARPADTADEELVVLELGWSAELVRALPAAALLRLTGDPHGVQERALGEATRRDGQVRVTFSWRGAALRTTLTLAAAGRTLMLWKDRAVAGQPPAPWEVDLSAWLQHPDAGAGGDEVVASLPELQGPVHEHARGEGRFDPRSAGPFT